MISSLEYKPTKDDTNAQFTCSVTYFGPTGQETIRSESVAFDIHCKFKVPVSIPLKDHLFALRDPPIVVLWWLLLLGLVLPST